jgi:hypothetical protein
MLDSPLDHRAQNWSQILTLRGEPILDPGRVIAVSLRLNDAGADQPFEALRQDVRRDTFR